MDWAFVLLGLAASVGAILILAGRSVRPRPTEPGPEPDDPHAAVLAEMEASQGPRIYDP